MAKKKVVLMEFEGNPNIGLYMFVNDRFCILGRDVSEEKRKEIERVFDVPVYKTTILGTELIGVFAAGNNDLLIVPELYEYEKIKLEEICKKHEVQLLVIKNWQNTYGNNICVGNDEILVNSEYSAGFVKELKTKSKLEVYTVNNFEYKNVGAVIKSVGDKFYVSQALSEKDVKSVVKKVVSAGTVNSGSNFVSSGIVANKNGLILGSMSSNVEIQDVVESLDYL